MYQKVEFVIISCLLTGLVYENLTVRATFGHLIK